MPIIAELNPNYGGALINQKYSPLQGIQFPAQEESEIRSDLLKRLAARRELALLGEAPQLTLCATNWRMAWQVAAPPLVIVSTGRSAWLKAQAQAKDQNLRPIYFSKAARGRQVLIVVNELEFDDYRSLLDLEPQPVIVGWGFRSSMEHAALLGFGASRFAAIQLCKRLGAKKAWLLDDNVLRIDRFPGFADCDAAMESKELVALGFQGATEAETDLKPQQWPPASAQIQEVNRKLLQQAVLWNIQMLGDRNFCPLFVASGEDVSFCNYLTKIKLPYHCYSGMSIRKMLASDVPNENLSEHRRKLEAACSGSERNRTIQLKSARRPEERMLDTFVPRGVDQNRWLCQAMEQLFCEMIKGHPSPKEGDPIHGFFKFQEEVEDRRPWG